MGYLFSAKQVILVWEEDQGSLQFTTERARFKESHMISYTVTRPENLKVFVVLGYQYCSRMWDLVTLQVNKKNYSNE